MRCTLCVVDAPLNVLAFGDGHRRYGSHPDVYPSRPCAPIRHILRVDDFLDMSAGSEGRFEFSEWVRAYGRYLDQQLDVYSSINFCLETEEAGSESRMRSLNTQDLLFQLPKLQRLLQRLTDCVPRGSTAKDPIVQVLPACNRAFVVFLLILQLWLSLAGSL